MTLSAPDSRAAREPHPGFGTGTRLWLLRHGTVHPDWHGRSYGDLDVPLSEQGERETVELARRFRDERPARVLSSPLARSLALGRALAQQCGAPLEVHADLREIQRGSWQGRRVAELHEEERESVAAFYADPWSFAAHGGENDAALLTRAWSVVERALADERLRGELLVLTTHYNVIRVLAAHLLGIAPPASFAVRIDPARAALFVDDPAGWTLVHSNVDGPPASTDDPRCPDDPR